ncbi:sunset domain-containing protein [Mesorhizobium abyssinicae]|uniref:sunset domain-containing protein n=1 Tax=Mesorhizobium abyssinicae TaxID=1209958 RepID=UPI0033991A9C
MDKLNIGADQADRWRKRLRKKRRSWWRWRYLFPLVMVPLAAFFSVSPTSLDTVAGLIPSGLLNGVAGGNAGSCNIKGNISIDTGERIYHVPGQEHYWETKISPQYGERWFCSEAEARAAGWRRARR